MRLPILAESKQWVLPKRKTLIWNNEQGSHHAHSRQDPHIWLDPESIQQVVRMISKRLSARNPAYEKQYSKNAQLLNQEISLLHSQTRKSFEKMKNKPFLVYHDAFQYFENSYQLNGLGAVAAEPSSPLTIKHIYRLKKLIKAESVKCIFAEPEVNVKKLRRLFRKTDLKGDCFRSCWVPIADDRSFLF